MDSTSNNNKRRSSANVNIWIHHQDDASSVSSLSSAFVLGGGSSSFYNHGSDGIAEASFDLTLMLEEEEEDTSLVMSVGVVRPRQRDWRWESDPNLPMQRDLGKNVDTPVIPLRRYSNSSRSLLQRPRMPRRQPSSDDCNSHDDELLRLPMDSSSSAKKTKKNRPRSRGGKNPSNRVESIGQRVSVPSKRSSEAVQPASPFFSERMRRFPIDLPTSCKAAASNRRIRGLTTRPCRLPRRRRSRKHEGGVQNN